MHRIYLKQTPMKKILIFSLMILGLSFAVQAQTQKQKVNVSDVKVTGTTNAANVAVIKFDTLRIDLGTFSEAEPVQKCSFAFTNTGTAPLIINQAFASCGCTEPTYPKKPIKPGEKGQIDVTYNGEGRFPGHFQKTVTIRTNAQNDIVRLTIEGTMTEKK